MKKTAISLLAYFEHSRFYLTIFFLIFALHLFLRFFELEPRMQFTWDQIQNSWVMKDMIVGGKLPLVGMVARGNSGLFIGPVYYYLLAPFYWIFNLDPIAAGVFAGVVSVITFLVFFVVTKQLFSLPVALITVFIYAISYDSIVFDRIPWPVIFIPLISTGIFYFLYRIIRGEPNALIPLSLLLGFSFHIHFTAVYYLPIILLSLPLWPRKRETVVYSILGLLVFVLWFIPNAVAEFGNKLGSTDKFGAYLQTYYHGFHLRRVFQLFYDAFIQFEGIVFVKPVNRFAYLILPAFSLLLLKKKFDKPTVVLIYLVCLWIIVPWIIMSLYSGEISNYYFAISRPFVFIAIGYIVWSVLSLRNTFASGLMIGFLGLYMFINLQSFWLTRYVTLPKHKAEVRQDIREGRTVKFSEGDPKSYLYYIYFERYQQP